MKEKIKFHHCAFALIFLVAAALYFNSLNNAFFFDDHPNILDNPYIRNLSDLSLFFQGVKSYTGLPRALTTLSFAINYHLHGLDVLGYHGVNLMLHILCGFLVFSLSRILFGLHLERREGPLEGKVPVYGFRVNFLALLTSLVFVSHPLQVNTVTYIVQRTEGLAGFFYLLSLFLFASGSFQRGRKKLVSFSGAGLSFACAVFAKETGFTIPITWIVFDFVFVCETKEDRLKRLRIYVPLLILLAVYLLFYLRGGIFHLLIKRTKGGELAPWHYLLTQSNVIIEYFKLMALPLPSWLNIDHDFPISRSFLEYPTFLSFPALVFLLSAAVWFTRKKKLASFAVFFFFIVLAPSSSVIPLWDAMVEYRLYLPVFSFSLILTAAFYDGSRFLARRFSEKLGMGLVSAASILLILFYSAITIERNRTFRDPLTLWSDVARKSPGKMRAHHNLGKAYFEKGQIDKALEEGEIALQLSARLDRKENVKFVLNLLGGIYLTKGETRKAEEMLQQAIEVDAGYATSYYNLSCVYAANREKEKAIEYLRKAISLDPKYKEKARSDRDLDPLRGLKEFQELAG